MLDNARQILDLVENIRQEGTDDAQKLTGEVQLACTPPFCKSFALDVFQGVKEKYPGIEIHLLGSDSEATLQMVHDGIVHIGIVHMDDVDRQKLRSQVERKQLQYGELLHEEMSLTVRAGHPLLKKGKLQLEDLLDYPYVTPDQNINPELHEIYQKKGRTRNICYVSDVCSVRALQYQADALAMTPLRAFLHGNQLFAEPVVALDIPELRHRCTVSWVTRATIQPSVRKVLEILIATCERIGDA